MKINEVRDVMGLNVERILDDVKAGSGTFKELLNDVKAGKIKALTNNANNIVGISYDKGVINLIDDNIELMKFEKKYCDKPLMQWMLGALKLKSEDVKEVIENGVNVIVKLVNGFGMIVYDEDFEKDDYDEEDYDEEDYDDYEDDIEYRVHFEEDANNLDESFYSRKQAIDYLYDVGDDQNIAGMVYKITEDDEEIIEKYTPKTLHNAEEFPKECMLIDKKDLPEITLSAIKKYLREKTGYYLSGKDPDPTFADYDSNSILVMGIHWGRKK